MHFRRADTYSAGPIRIEEGQYRRFMHRHKNYQALKTVTRVTMVANKKYLNDCQIGENASI